MRFFLLVSVVSFWMFSAHALYMGCPEEPSVLPVGIALPEDSLIGLKVGYQGDFTSDSRLKVCNGTRRAMNEVSLLSNQGVVTLGLFDRAEIYGSVGALKAYLTNRFLSDGKKRDFQTQNQLTWGVGTRVLLFSKDQMNIGLQGGFQSAEPHLKWNTVNGVAAPGSGSLDYSQWQVALGVSYAIDFFIPYVGMNYLRTKATLSGINKEMGLFPNHFKMRNRCWAGALLGCTLTASKTFDLTIEGRLFNELAFSLAGNIKF